MPTLARIASIVSLLALAACQRRTSPAHDPSPDPIAARHPCALPDVVDQEVVLDGDCAISAKADVRITAEGTLRISAGARVTMNETAVIRVEGALFVQGNDGAPATITTVAPKTSYAALPFFGGIFVEGEHARVVLDHASIERGGTTGLTTDPVTTDGALRVLKTTARVSIVATSFRMAHGTAVNVVAPNFHFDAFERNVLESDGDVALSIPTTTLATMGEGNLVHGQRVRTTGPVETSAHWPLFDGPFAPEGDLVLSGKKGDPTILTLPRGAAVAMGDDAALVVDANAGLIARGVRFTSAKPNPWQGAWVGLVLRGAPVPTIVEDSVVEYAGGLGKSASKWGRTYDHHPAIDATDAPSLRIVRTTFRADWIAVFDTTAGDGCGKLASASSGNIALGGAALCRERGMTSIGGGESASTGTFLHKLFDQVVEQQQQGALVTK
jgi:hypothetical protein